MKTAVFPNTSGITACLYTQRPSAGHSKIYNYHLIPKKSTFKHSSPIFSFFILQTYIISMSLWIYSALRLFFSILSIPPSSSLLLHLFPPLTGTLSFFSGYLDRLFSCPTLLLLSLVQASEEETQKKCIFINASQGLG